MNNKECNCSCHDDPQWFKDYQAGIITKEEANKLRKEHGRVYCECCIGIAGFGLIPTQANK